MRRRLATILMIAALIFTSGTFEMFAAGAENDEAANSVDAVAAEEQAVEAEGEPAVDAESTDAAVEEGTVEEGTVEEGVVEEVDPDGTEPEEPVDTADEESEAPHITGLENVTAEAEGTKVTLSWTFKEGESLGEGETLTVKYQENGEEKVVENVTASPVEITDLAANTEYTFNIYFGEENVGSASAATGLAEITNITKVRSYNKVYLSWDPVEGATKYVIQWSNKMSGNSGTVEVTSPEWAHYGISANDVVNTSTGYEGDLSGGDRYTWVITAYNGENAIAEATETGDVIKTMYYKLSFKKAATLTSHSGGKKKVKFKKKQVVYARAFSDGKFMFDYKCSDGKVRTFHTMKIRVTAKLSPHINAVKDKKKRGTGTFVYTSEEAEKYVNDRGIKSQSKYMVWVNLYTQREYVFYSKSKGKKKDWAIVTANKHGLKNQEMSALSVSTGKPTKPTATGSWKIVRKMKSQHGIPMWNVTKYFSLHGVSKSMPTPGWPESGACVRNFTKNIKWIYNTLPKYSRVLVH